MTGPRLATSLFRVRLRRLDDGPLDGPRREFHLQRAARDTFGFDDSFFSLRGDVVFADLFRSHEFAQALNRVRALAAEEPVRASQLNAMGLVHEIFHAVFAAYRRGVRPRTLQTLGAKLRERQGEGADAMLLRFLDAFPPPVVYRGTQSAREYLGGTTGGVPNRSWVMEELLLLWLTNQNPGYAPIGDLVSDEPMKSDPGYRDFIETARTHFESEPGFGPGRMNLIDLLLEPSRRHPDSLEAQLEFMRTHWGLEGLDELMRLLMGLDFIREEGKWFLRKGHGVGGDTAVRTFRGDLYESEPEKFSPDLDWMPKVVMIAKSTFVWLDQLSKRYGRAVRSLADIPDEELDLLRGRGFTALWLIGVWRRSGASRRLKQLSGNPDAAASAYSLKSYDIAPELGGWDAWRDLHDRAWRRGIRLASDMVPNHTGLDSDWMIEHPDWFVQSDRPPFPNYTFDGPDLSEEDRIAINIEDGYWRRSDAAVVFKRYDRRTGDTRFIYHGNDGTSMPWNDTAQLDYLRSDVREAVIQTILHVARHFPIIRFDAAMTLAKRHYERLWFPQPGAGGDIPSRAAFAMPREKFEEAFPVEFWREVVDRVQQEAPDTLLLAEAFWLMEGYFVRTLGMHRVYNSAFMNMLKREENASFRSSIRNVLEFNPQILKRHVNFMNNPDEESAVAQFGKDDKYFGVCLMMSTMPGLPMFGHGQVEGFTEKYGMEYVRAYRDEQPDQWLIDRHTREIFPLLERRHLFSDVESFHLYDFETPSGTVDEDVFAWSNRSGDERALLLFHNKYKQTRGRVRTSVGYLGPSGAIERRTLAQGLGLRDEPRLCSLFRDHISGLEYVRENAELVQNGLYAELGAFRYHAFVDWQEVSATDAAPWDDLARSLGGAGVPSLQDAMVDYRFNALHAPFYQAVNVGSAEWLLGRPHAAARETESEAKGTKTVAPARWLPPVEVEESFRRKVQDLIDGLKWRYPRVEVSDERQDEFVRRFRVAWERMPLLSAAAGVPSWQLTTALLFCHVARELQPLAEPASLGTKVVREWHLDRVLIRALREAEADEDTAARATDLLDLLVRSGDPDLGRLARTLLRLLAEPEARAFLRVNVYEAVAWFDKERFEDLVAGLRLAAAAAAPESASMDAIEARAQELIDLAAANGYRLEPLLSALRDLAERCSDPMP